MPITPAIINAIYNAVGVRITDLPASKERVLEALTDRCMDFLNSAAVSMAPTLGALAEQV